MSLDLNEVKIERIDLVTLDVTQLTKMLHLAYEPLARSGLRFTATYQDDKQTISRLQNADSFLATIGEKFIGTISLYTNDPDHRVPYYRTPGLCYFGQFGVLPEASGIGLGRRLYSICETEARKRGFEQIALDTSEKADDLIGLYLRWGFSQVDTFQWGDTNYLSLIMAKKLE